ncbi:MAG: threonylcarbamoyl-AMP synthase [Bacteroidetes bacterium]|nr:threonylcarbamoyl-AMP synthase [Bacteroidota bacterium]
MLLKITPAEPEEEKIRIVRECLLDDGVVIYPTDTVYGIGCHIHKPKAIEQICRIKGIRVEKANFSFIFSDLSHLSDFTKPVDNSIYKVMRKALPGPFTFILHANSEIPKIFRSRKKTIGIRVPDNSICRKIVKQLESPLMNSSLHDEEDEIAEYLNDPEKIYEKYHKLVDIVIDGGYGNLTASTVVDCSEGRINILRQGLGIIEGY